MKGDRRKAKRGEKRQGRREGGRDRQEMARRRVKRWSK